MCVEYISIPSIYLFGFQERRDLGHQSCRNRNTNMPRRRKNVKKNMRKISFAPTKVHNGDDDEWMTPKKTFRLCKKPKSQQKKERTKRLTRPLINFNPKPHTDAKKTGGWIFPKKTARAEKISGKNKGTVFETPRSVLKPKIQQRQRNFHLAVKKKGKVVKEYKLLVLKSREQPKVLLPSARDVSIPRRLQEITFGTTSLSGIVRAASIEETVESKEKKKGEFKKMRERIAMAAAAVALKKKQKRVAVAHEKMRRIASTASTMAAKAASEAVCAVNETVTVIDKTRQKFARFAASIAAAVARNAAFKVTAVVDTTAAVITKEVMERDIIRNVLDEFDEEGGVGTTLHENSVEDNDNDSSDSTLSRRSALNADAAEFKLKPVEDDERVPPHYRAYTQQRQYAHNIPPYHPSPCVQHQQYAHTPTHYVPTYSSFIPTFCVQPMYYYPRTPPNHW